MKVRTFLSSHPRLRNSIVTPAIMFSVGFGIGYYIALLIQKETSVFGIPAIIIAGFGGLGALSVVIRPLIDWHSDNREKEKIPILEFDSFYKIVEYQVTYENEIYDHTAYFLRIKDTNSKSEGKIERCEGFIRVNGSNEERSIRRTPTVWLDNELRRCDFSMYSDLRLFSATGTTSIVFPIAKEEHGFIPNTKDYTNFINESLIVEVYCQRGTIGENIRSFKINDIIKTAILEEK